MACSSLARTGFLSEVQSCQRRLVARVSIAPQGARRRSERRAGADARAAREAALWPTKDMTWTLTQQHARTLLPGSRGRDPVSLLGGFDRRIDERQKRGEFQQETRDRAIAETAHVFRVRAD